jgi:hypothetical protein
MFRYRKRPLSEHLPGSSEGFRAALACKIADRLAAVVTIRLFKLRVFEKEIRNDPSEHQILELQFSETTRLPRRRGIRVITRTCRFVPN